MLDFQASALCTLPPRPPLTKAVEKPPRLLHKPLPLFLGFGLPYPQNKDTQGAKEGVAQPSEKGVGGSRVLSAGVGGDEVSQDAGKR